jgi:hypothetical protein
MIDGRKVCYILPASAHSIMSNVWCFQTVEPCDGTRKYALYAQRLARFTDICLALSDDEIRSVWLFAVLTRLLQCRRHSCVTCHSWQDRNSGHDQRQWVVKIKLLLLFYTHPRLLFKPWIVPPCSVDAQIEMYIDNSDLITAKANLKDTGLDCDYCVGPWSS